MTDAVRQTILDEIEKGRSLLSVCKDEGMPNRSTVQRWQNEDEAFDAAVTRAREDGFHYLAEQARINAQTAEDAAKGRLAFDADRWYLGKLSNAFSDNKTGKIEHSGLIALKGIEIQFGRTGSA
jgi:hypothetical protein